MLECGIRGGVRMREGCKSASRLVLKPYESEERTPTYHSLPQDEALRGASVDLQLNGFW